MYKFSRFKNQTDVETILGLAVKESVFTPGETTIPIEPDPVLVASLKRAIWWPLHSEMVIRETLISPVLSEVYSYYKPRLTFFSSEELKYVPDPQKSIAGEVELGGTCDYVIGGRPDMRRIQAPILAVVEAKKEDFETGTWQCAAELYACRLLNLRAGVTFPYYYGCVTSGKVWKFICLEGEFLITDAFDYSLSDNLPRLLGVWRWLLDRQIEHLPPEN